MDEPNRHRTRPIIIDALKQAGSTFAAHRAFVLVLRSVKYLLGVLLLLCLADALFHFTSGSRFGFILGTGGILAILAFTAIGIAVFARPGLVQVARRLEGRNADLGSKLTNVLQLDAQAGEPRRGPPGVRIAGVRVELHSRLFGRVIARGWRRLLPGAQRRVG